MACNFWDSTQYKASKSLSWEKIASMHEKDRSVISADDVSLIKMYFCRLIQRIGYEKFKVRPRVVATAIMFFRRYYAKEEFSDHDPLLIAPVCFLSACKADECQIQLNRVAVAVRELESKFSYTNAALSAAEYEVLKVIDYNVVVFDVYTELKPLLVSSGIIHSLADLEGHMDPVCQSVWSAVNDSYLLTDAALLFPPHVVALACIAFGACVMHNKDLRWWFSTLSRRPDLEADMHHVWEIVSVMLDGYHLFGDVHKAQQLLEKLDLPLRPVPATSL